MPIYLCPNCARKGNSLTDTSTYAAVNYFRCNACGHVWTLSKTDPHAPPSAVTRVATETPQPDQ